MAKLPPLPSHPIICEISPNPPALPPTIYMAPRPPSLMLPTCTPPSPRHTPPSPIYSPLALYPPPFLPPTPTPPHQPLICMPAPSPHPTPNICMAPLPPHPMAMTSKMCAYPPAGAPWTPQTFSCWCTLMSCVPVAAAYGGPAAASRHVTQTRAGSCGRSSTAASVTSQQMLSPTPRYVTVTYSSLLQLHTG